MTSLLSGHVVATRIFGGGPPRSRLQEIPWNLVESVGTVVKLKPTDIKLDADWVERWLRDRIIKHIPGGQRALSKFLGRRVIDAAQHPVGP